MAEVPQFPSGTRSTHVLEEEMELRATAGVDGDLEQGQEDVLQHLLKVGQLLLGVVDIAVGRA